MNIIKIISFFFLFSFVSGCFPTREEPPCWVRQEEWKLVNAYEFFSGYELTEDELSCLGNYKIVFASDREFKWRCGDFFKQSISACARPYTNRPNIGHTIFFHNSYFVTLSDAQQRELASHELTHFLLWCLPKEQMDGFGWEGHNHPVWEELPPLIDDINLHNRDGGLFPDNICEESELSESL